jgi:lysozyme
VIDLTIAIELCKRFEGFRAKPYLCPAGVPTIGYGSTYYSGGKKVSMTDAPISNEDAEKLLKHELNETYLPEVLRLCPVLKQHPNKLNAIVDFCYNLGAGNLQRSTLRRRINAQDWQGAEDELKKWVKAGGVVLPGLVKRREAEIVFMKG